MVESTSGEELARWQGRIEERVDQTQKQVKTLTGDVHTIKEEIVGLRVDLATVKTKVAVWAAVAAVVGAASASAGVQLLVR